MSCWLMKAEPDSRIVKGKDVKFSVDDFEKIGESPWDGVRNHQAKGFMKDKMKIGDKVLFYHSNTKIPGVAAIAEVSKEGYPDYTAWDETHPYYDPKTKEDNPTWFMVSVTFKRRLSNFVSLELIKHLATLSSPPEALGYLTQEHLDAIKAMPLISRGRLSVQPVDQTAFEAIDLLGEKGGFDDLVKKPTKRKAKAKDEEEEEKPARKRAIRKKAKKVSSDEEEED